MAKIIGATAKLAFSRSRFKKTSIGNGHTKMSSMNKAKKRSHKRYRGQGK